MAQVSDDVILRIKIDEGAEQKKLVDLRKNINLVKEEQKKLADAIKLAGGATDAQIQKQIQLEGTLKDLQGEQRNSVRVMENLDKVYKANEGSITQLRAKLSVLTAQWNDLSEEERENAEIGGLLQKRTKEISDALKTQEGRIGDNRRSVGSYTESILAASDGSGKLGNVISTLKGIYGELSETIGAAKESIQAEAEAKLASKAATDASTVSTNINKAAIIGNVAALKLLKYALLATGIGAVLVLLGGLISFLTRTQEGIDLVNTKMKGFTTVISVVIDQLSAVGKSILEFINGIESMGDLLEKLGKGILDGLITRFKGLGVILDGIINRDFSKIQDGIAQSTIGVTDATAKSKEWADNLNEVRKSAEGIEREYQRLRDAERALSVDREKANVLIEQNKKIAEDVTKSESERVAAAKRADVALTDITNRQLSLQRERIKNIEAEQALTNNLTADNDQLAQEQAKLYQLEAANTGRSIELQNKLNSIRQEGAAKARAATLAQLEAEAQLLQVRSESSLNTDEAVLELRLQLLQKNLQKELMAENLTALQKQAIRARSEQEAAQLRSEYEAKQATEAAANAEQQTAMMLEGTRKALAEGSANALLELKKQRADGLISAQEYNEKLSQADLVRRVAEIAALQQFAGDVAGIDEEIAAKRMELSNVVADHQIANNARVEQQEQERKEATLQRLQEEGEATAAFVSSIGEMFAASLSQQGLDLEQFTQGVVTLLLDTMEKAVTAAVLQATLKTTAAALSSPDSIATFGVAGLAKAALITGLIKGAFAIFKAGLSSAFSSKTPKVFATGGFTGTSALPADHTGHRPVGVVHENEYVAPQWQVKHPVYGQIIRGLNEVRLRGFANGGYTTLPTFAAPMESRGMMAGQMGVTIDYDKMAQAIAKVQVVASVKEVVRKTGSYQAKMNVAGQ